MFFRLFERFFSGVFETMSHVVSLCSQRCTCGRLTRNLTWLENECEERNACGVMEMRLALDIAWAGCIGCGCGDELDAFAALNSLSECDDKSEDHRKCETMKGRALACAASFLQREKKNNFFESPAEDQR